MNHIFQNLILKNTTEKEIMNNIEITGLDEFLGIIKNVRSSYDDIDFNDEIVKIEYVHEEELIDIEVSGNSLFYANDILTHNSAVNTTDADNSAISDSLGTAMTADFMLFLLQDEEMKARGEIVLKCTKNRFTGRTDTWMMNIDYEHMRFSDMIIQGDVSINDILDNQNIPGTSALDDEFGVITAAKQKKAEEFANQEIKDILHQDFENLKKADDPFKSEIDDIFAELGLE